MEDQRRNGVAVDAVSKRDKKRSNIAARLNKLELTFKNDRDMFYRNSLHELQNKLASLQQGSNEEYLAKKISLEETRDYELTKLRLWEEYQVKRVETVYQSDLQKAQENHDKMIKLIKEKLYDKLQKQIKHLQEDKYLLNVLSRNSYNEIQDGSNGSSSKSNGNNDQIKAAVNLRLRKRDATADTDDLSDGGKSGNISSAQNGSGYISSSKRRKPYRYSSNDEVSSSAASANPWHNNAHKKGHSHANNGQSLASGYESNLSDKDYDALNTLIMEDGTTIIDSLNGENGNLNNKVQTRGSHKQFIGPQGLKPEELNDDLTLLRNAIVKKQR
ncbi:uncharacterized protein LODBEIA_P14690 [Lodderomyces beijingensis]|uniref:Transcriptional regulatory protein SDS3 n=1 Tax=Lodderomyces beijingensis TaxID=1775926 RepID=A0ABP0ZLT0_9ASCO